MHKLAALVTVVSLAAAPAAHAQWTTVYSNDFSSGVGSNLTVTSGSTLGIYNPGTARSGCSSANFCNAALGRTGGIGFDNQAVTLALTGLGAHTRARVGFDLLLLDSWDGSHSGVGPDYITVSQGGTQLMQATFSHFAGYTQSYPDAVGANNPAYSGAFEMNTLGTGSWSLSSVYRMEFDFEHTGANLTFAIGGSNLQGWGDEGWALDNLRAEVQPAQQGVVPEPSTYMLLASGLGVIGAVARRRAARA